VLAHSLVVQSGRQRNGKTETFFLAHGGLPAWLAWFDVSFEVLVMVCLIVGILGFGRAIGRQKQSAVSPEKIWCPSFAPS
jgi:hypothetical protein